MRARNAASETAAAERATAVAVEVVPGSALRSFVVRGAQPVTQSAAQGAAPQAAPGPPPPAGVAAWSPSRARAAPQPEEQAGVARSLDELARRLGALESAVQTLSVRNELSSVLVCTALKRINPLQARMHVLERDAQPVAHATAAPPAAAVVQLPQHGETDELQAYINGVTERLEATRLLLITQS